MTDESLKYPYANFKLDCGRRALVKCESCNSENYTPNVLTGICTWCGYDINKPEKTSNDP